MQLSAFIEAELVYHQQSVDILQALLDSLKKKSVLVILCRLITFSVCCFYGHHYFARGSGCKVLLALKYCWPDCKPEGPLFSAEFVCLSVCVSLTGTSTLQRLPILMKLGHKDPTVI